ncbi:hypothetical protein chiPu_0021507, partial [Chiloscyllium punctatum]|nr:hypothetical protein [Chiloscyllium punctatum]
MGGFTDGAICGDGHVRDWAVCGDWVEVTLRNWGTGCGVRLTARVLDLSSSLLSVVSFLSCVQVHLDYCSLYRLEAACNKDPECVWCQAQCQSYQQHSPCPHVACLGLAKQLSDCQACLVFGQSWESLPQAPVSLGWCVQTSTCLPVTDQDSCRVDPVAGIAGWWGSDTTFITALQQCQRLNFQPGLHLVTYLNPPNISQPDK